jgi:hypothetical protein
MAEPDWEAQPEYGEPATDPGYHNDYGSTDPRQSRTRIMTVPPRRGRPAGPAAPPPRRPAPSGSGRGRRRPPWQRAWRKLRNNPVLLILCGLLVLVALPALAYTGARALDSGDRNALASAGDPGTVGQPGLGIDGSGGPSASASANPSGSPSQPVGGQQGPNGCGLTALLVPTCGHLVGAAPNAFSSVDKVTELKTWEAKVGRKMDIFHMYHSGDELFPTDREMSLTTEPGANRILLLNWKVAAGSNWAAVARGDKDARIDRLAAYIKANVHKKFFLALHHEPEEEVRNTAGSGWTAKDYGNMWRHVVTRMKADGVTQVVWTIIFMGFANFSDAPWFDDLYPGDDIVDWIAYDPYMYADANGDFARLVNRKTAKFPGFYTWATTKHPSKPLMLAEWGIFESATDKTLKPKMYATVAGEIGQFPAIKAICYFNSPIAPRGDTRVDSTPEALAAFRRMMAASVLQAHIM